MTKCQCTKDKTITLATDEKVCSYCHKHLFECEAREILQKPFDERAPILEKLEKKRGNIDGLKQAMINIHKKSK